MKKISRAVSGFHPGSSFSILLLLLLAFSWFHPEQSIGQDYKIYTEEFPPYNYTDKGKTSGISTEIVREILRRLDHPDTIEVALWSNAYRLTQKEDNIILYSTTRTPIREDLFKWVGPLVPNNNVFFARTASGISIKTLEDAKKVGRIGVYKDDFGELLLKDKGFTNLRSVPDNSVNIEDLVIGKIDLWIINELTGKHMARKMNLENKIEKVFDVQKEFMYMAFSKNTPDSVINLWQNTLDEIKADGTYAQIFSKWIMFSYTEDLKPATRVKLNKEEQAWLDKHPIIKVATDPDYPPFQYTEDGISRGIANDYLELMSEKLGVTIEPVLTNTWLESQELVKKGEADLLAVAAKTPERKAYLLFTKPYVIFPDVIVVRNNGLKVSSLDQLKGKSLASITGFAVNNFLLENYPEIRIVEKPDTLSLLKSVSTGEVDAATLNLATLSHQIENTKITNLRISTTTDFSYELTFASRKDWPLLNSILNKTLYSLTEEEKKKIYHKWIFLSQSKSRASNSESVNLTSEERGWLSRHPVVTIAPDPAWPPIEFLDDGGTFIGMSADYIALLEAKLPITFEVRRLKNWESIIAAAKDRTIDMTTSTVATPDRKTYMDFTKPYLHLPSVIIVSNKVKGRVTMEDLRGKTVSAVSEYASHEYMKENYPEINIEPVFNTVAGLRNVAYGKSYAFVANVATSSHLMEKEVMQNLRIAGESGYTFHLALASRNDWPILNSILEKGLDQISLEEHQTIFRKWIPIAEKPWITIKQFFIGLATVSGVVFIIGIVVWNKQLRYKVETRTKELRASEENFKNLYKTALVGLFRTSINGMTMYSANPAFAELFGYETDTDVIENLTPNDCYADPNRRDELVEILRTQGKVEEFEFLGKRFDGSTRNFLLNAFIYEDEGYIEGAILDITERKKNDEIIRKLAMTDPLTGLANRNQFNKKLDDAISHSKRFDHAVGLLFIDLDDFKPVNDNYGHPVGDALLLHVAQELNATFREVDTTARIGGDEFAVILNGVSSKQDALRLAEKLLIRLSTPVLIEEYSVQVGASIGLSFFPWEAKEKADMLGKADKALYQAKTLGKNQICLDESFEMEK